MSIDRVLGAALVALLALGPAAPAQPDQQPDPEATPDQAGRRGLGQVPDDPSLLDEPPAAVDPLDQEELDKEAETSGIGSFFLSNVAVASAYDRVERASGAPGAGDLTGSDDDGEISYLLRPSFLLVHRPNARGGVVIGYEPELETYQDDSSEDISHSAGLDYQWRVSRRTDVAAGASYLDSLDPSRHLGGEGFVLIPGRFEQSRAYFGASHLWPRATRLHFFTEYSSAASDLDTGDTAFDVSDLSGTLALEQGIGRRSDITFSYSYTESDLEVLESTLPTLQSSSGPVDAFRIGYGHRAGRGYSFHLSGGALREQATDGAEEDVSWIGGAELARETDVLKLRLRYDRSLFAFGYGNAEAPSGIEDALGSGAVVRGTSSDTLSFGLELLPHHRVRLDQSLWLSRQSVLEGDDAESFVSGTQVEVLLTGRSIHRLVLLSRLDYFDRSESDFLGLDVSRTRFSLGVRVGLSGPQTKVGQQLAMTELRRVLPSGGNL